MIHKLDALDQIFTAICRVFRKGFMRHWEIVTERINLRSGTSYTAGDINITFATNAPDDKQGDMERATSALKAGLLSHETSIGISGVEVDPKKELERIREEQQVEYEPELLNDDALAPEENEGDE